LNSARKIAAARVDAGIATLHRDTMDIFVAERARGFQVATASVHGLSAAAAAAAAVWLTRSRLLDGRYSIFDVRCSMLSVCCFSCLIP
jgi:hypothetical protein